MHTPSHLVYASRFHCLYFLFLECIALEKNEYIVYGDLTQNIGRYSCVLTVRNGFKTRNFNPFIIEINNVNISDTTVELPLDPNLKFLYDDLRNLINDINNGVYNGATFTPELTADGNLTWSNDKLPIFCVKSPYTIYSFFSKAIHSITLLPLEIVRSYVLFSKFNK